MADHLLAPHREVQATFVASTRLPTRWGNFLLHAFDAEGREHLALTYGDIQGDSPVLARVHSECLTGDALFSQRCDCGEQLASAMKAIVAEGRGVILYLRQEGRGIGLLNKVRAYALQDMGFDTVDANEHLGFAADARNYSVCKSMLDHLGIRQLRLMTNNPRKLDALKELGFTITARVPHIVGSCPSNTSYLDTKAVRLGHLLER